MEMPTSLGSNQNLLALQELTERKKTKAAALGKQTGRWTKEEHDKFIVGLKQYGRDWKSVEIIVISRSSTQIRSHAQKFFNRIKKAFNTSDPVKYVSEKLTTLELQNLDICMEGKVLSLIRNRL